MKRLVAIALLLAASCSGKEGDPAAGPGSFALSLPVEPAPDAQVQRVDLPAQAIVALKRADSGDIRVFDARGKPLSIARLAEDPAKFSTVHLSAIPFNAKEGAESAPSVSVSVTQSDHAVTVDTGGGHEAAQQSGVLIDTRQVKEPAVDLTLDATLPAQRPVTMSVKASSDLKAWEPLAEQVLFRPGDGPALLGSGAIDLHGEKLEHRYLLVSWSSSANATVTGATLRTAPNPPPQRIAIPVNGLKLGDGHVLQFALPPSPAPAAMRLTMTGQDGVVPVSLFGRNATEQPWTPLAVGVLRQNDGAARLAAGDLREFKLEADARSAGFSQAPRLEFQYEPVGLLVAFNGAGPYRLAVGNAAASPAFLNAADLTAQTGPYATACVESGGQLAPIQLQASGGDTPFGKRKLLLWGTLLLGVAVLAVAAYWL
ncbi:MAG: DUF3999 family protein, partial [Nevskiales bacterium]